ncbi:hypothetical protein KKD70_00460 [Patescibacteria group bacterium]|nr:hypothetical protein [Patescibacteria group bacterium]
MVQQKIQKQENTEMLNIYVNRKPLVVDDGSSTVCRRLDGKLYPVWPICGESSLCPPPWVSSQEWEQQWEKIHALRAQIENRTASILIEIGAQ